MSRLITVYALTKEQGIFRIRVPEKAPVAQLDRVPGYELGGRRFESFRARQITKQKTATEFLGSRFLFPSRIATRFPPAGLVPSDSAGSGRQDFMVGRVCRIDFLRQW